MPILCHGGAGPGAYFLQKSGDLVTWEYLPLIESGAGAVLGRSGAAGTDRFFLRLKFTDDPASDPALADFDGDGVGSLDEINAGTDPLDFYNGLPPQLIPLVGDGQTVLAGGSAPRAFELLVRSPAGAPLPNAPITFRLASGGGALAAEPGTGATLSASMTVRADYAGRVRPPVSAVLFHGGAAPGPAVVEASGGGAVVQFSLSVTAEGPLAAPAFLRSTASPDGSTLFAWSPPASGLPAGASIVLLGRAADGQWQTIATLASAATTYAAAAAETAGLGAFALRVLSGSGESPSALSNVLGDSPAASRYAVLDLGAGTPLGVASDGTVVIQRLPGYSLVRNRAGVDETLNPNFGFYDMNDRGDIVGVDNAYLTTAYAILADQPATTRTRWAGAGYSTATESYYSRLTKINEQGTVAGNEYHIQRSGAGGAHHTSLSKDFLSTAPLSLQIIASSTTFVDLYESLPSTSSGNSYSIEDLDNNGGAVGMKHDVTTGVESSLYYAEHIVDGNDGPHLQNGEDNKSIDNSGMPFPGIFAANEDTSITLKVGSDGVATLPNGGVVEFIVGMQPGDNYRIAMALKPEDLDVINVHSNIVAGYVKPSDEQPSGFNGIVSPMLTV